MYNEQMNNRAIIGSLIVLPILLAVKLYMVTDELASVHSSRRELLERLQIKYYELKIDEMLIENDDQEGCCYESPLSDRSWKECTYELMD